MNPKMAAAVLLGGEAGAVAVEAIAAAGGVRYSQGGRGLARRPIAATMPLGQEPFTATGGEGIVPLSRSLAIFRIKLGPAPSGLQVKERMLPKWTKAFLLPAVLFAAALASAAASVILVDDFADGLAPQWQAKSFADETHYTATREDNQSCIRAESAAAASGLYYQIEFEPREYPILSWSWKVDHVLARGDATTKAGDDYAARVYVVFPSWLFWKTRALNYVWANRLPQGTFRPNAYTANAMMIAVRSGPAESGTWQQEERNIYEDFRRAFGEEPPKAGAVAIMTDTDNTGESALAWYGPIRLRSRRPSSTRRLNAPAGQAAVDLAGR